jgi:hypothetical protein
MYGLEYWEHFEESIRAAIERLLDESCDATEVGIEAQLDRVTWPVTVSVYRQMELPTPNWIAERILRGILEDLDQDHSDPDGNATEPTPNMKSVALALGEIIVNEYEVWACERTNETHTITRDQAKAILGGEVKTPTP